MAANGVRLYTLHMVRGILLMSSIPISPSADCQSLVRLDARVYSLATHAVVVAVRLILC